MRHLRFINRALGSAFGRATAWAGLGLALLAAAPAMAQQGGGNTAVVAQECVSCHGSSAVGRRIPPLWGIEPGQFVAAMEAFRSGARDNPTMVIIARGLSIDMVVDLANHFAGQTPPAGN